MATIDDTGTTPVAAAPRRRWTAPVGLFASGLLAGGLVVAGVSAAAGTSAAASPSPVAAVAPAVPGGIPDSGAVPDTAPVPNSTSSSSTAAALQAAVQEQYPGSTVLSIVGDPGTGYRVRLVTSDGEMIGVLMTLPDDGTAGGSTGSGTADEGTAAV